MGLREEWGAAGGVRVSGTPCRLLRSVWMDGQNEVFGFHLTEKIGSLGLCSGCMAVYITEVSVKFCPSKERIDARSGNCKLVLSRESFSECVWVAS